MPGKKDKREDRGKKPRGGGGGGGGGGDLAAMFGLGMAPGKSMTC